MRLLGSKKYSSDFKSSLVIILAIFFALLIIVAAIILHLDSKSSAVLLRDDGTMLCGNWKVDVDEECDDGNKADGDGCNVRCNTEPAAGEILPL